MTGSTSAPVAPDLGQVTYAKRLDLAGTCRPCAGTSDDATNGRYHTDRVSRRGDVVHPHPLDPGPRSHDGGRQGGHVTLFGRALRTVSSQHVDEEAFAGAPPRTGKPSDSSWSRCPSRVQLCSARFANPSPGSRISRFGSTPAFTASSTASSATPPQVAPDSNQASYARHGWRDQRGWQPQRSCP